jgi:hypothetical protein
MQLPPEQNARGAFLKRADKETPEADSIAEAKFSLGMNQDWIGTSRNHALQTERKFDAGEQRRNSTGLGWQNCVSM